MRATSTGKRRYNLIKIAIIVLVVSILFGYLFDFVCEQIDYYVYSRPEEYSAFVERYSREYDVPEAMVYAVIKTESGFDPEAISGKNAVGLMQMLPSTFEWLTNDILHDGHSSNMLYDPQTNIKYGTYYLSRLYMRFGNWNTALAAYNGGEGNVSGWLSDTRYSDDGVELKIDKLPLEFSETKDYVKKVNKAMKKYQELYYKD